MDRSKPTHRVADRQQGVGVDVQQPKRRLRFLLELQVERRQSRTQAERSRGQQHVLNRWIDRRARRVGRSAPL